MAQVTWQSDRAKEIKVSCETVKHLLLQKFHTRYSFEVFRNRYYHFDTLDSLTLLFDLATYCAGHDERDLDLLESAMLSTQRSQNPSKR